MFVLIVKFFIMEYCVVVYSLLVDVDLEPRLAVLIQFNHDNSYKEGTPVTKSPCVTVDEYMWRLKQSIGMNEFRL